MSEPINPAHYPLRRMPPQHPKPYDPTRPPRESSRALAFFVILLAVIAGASGAVFYGDRVVSFVVKPDPLEAAAAAAPTRSAPPILVATPSAASETKITLLVPDKLGDLARNTEPANVSAANLSISSMQRASYAREAMAAFYGSHQNKTMVMVGGVTLRRPLTEAEFETEMATAGSIGTVSGKTNVDPGPLGGMAKCLHVESGQIKMTMCGWTDQGSLVIVVWYYKDVAAAKKDLIGVRSQIEKAA